MPAAREDLRNVAIVAHVDHGKTTLVDAMLWQSGAFRANQDVAERVLDSMDLEREKGITILAKNTAVRYRGVKLNIVDTPGHADFGGEVERGLTMVDGVLLLVDASEGPLPQTRFVLRKALEARLPVILVVNKVDRPDARIAEVVDEVYELFLDLDADEEPDRVPHRLLQRQGRPGRRDARRAGRGPRAADGPPARARARAAPRPGAPAPGPRDEPRRVAVRRPPRALPRAPRRRSAAASRSPGAGPTAGRACPGRRALRHRGARSRGRGGGRPRRDHRPRRPGRGDDRRDAGRPRRPAAAAGDHGRRAVALGDRSASTPRRSPAARARAHRPPGRARGSTRSSSATSRCGCYDTERPDAWEVQGRGELQLAVLVELMRREGFELTVGQPQVLTREIDGRVHEPVERLTVDVPEEYVGVVTPAARAAQGPHGADGQPRHGLGPDGLPRPRPRPDRLPHRVPHGDARHGPAAPRLRPLGAVGRGAAHAADRRAGRRPPRRGGPVRPDEPAGARDAVRRARRGASTRG